MNFSPEKLFLVGLIALVVLGPNRLPQAARTAGRLLAEFRRMSASLQNEVTAAISEPRDALHQAVGDFGLGDVRSSIRSTINEVVAGTTGYPAPGSAVNGVSGAVGAPMSPPDAAVPPDAAAHDVAGLQTGAADHTGPSTPAPMVRSTPAPPDDPSFN